MQKKSISTTQKKEFYMQKKRFYLFEKVKKRKEKKSISTHPLKCNLSLAENQLMYSML